MKGEKSEKKGKKTRKTDLSEMLLQGRTGATLRLFGHKLVFREKAKGSRKKR